MQKRDAGGTGLHGSERSGHGLCAAPTGDDMLRGLANRFRVAMEHLCLVPAIEPFHLQPARLERADAAGDDERLRDEARSGIGGHVEGAVAAPLQAADLLPEVKADSERCDLLLQALDELAPRAVGQRRNVVDGLVGVELEALAAGMRQRIDNLGGDLEQAELEHLEQADRAGADDQRIGRDRGRRCIATHFRGRAGRACRCGLSTRRHRAAASCAA